MIEDHLVQYVGLERVDGPLIFVGGARGVGYDELVAVRDERGRERLGTVLEVSRDTAIVQVLEGTTGLSTRSTRVRFIGRSLSLRVSRRMLGRIFDGLGRPLDGGPPPLGGVVKDVQGRPINPAARDYPREFIQTGLSIIDGSNSLVRGQKLPIFSGSGLPHERLAAQIVRQATLPGEGAQRPQQPERPPHSQTLGDSEGPRRPTVSRSDFAVVMAAMGVKNDVAQFFQRDLQDGGAMGHAALFLSPADAPSVERLMAPRSALTLAEHLAFEEDMHVLVILTDMTNYCDALREIASARGEVPARKGYPGYLYSDLASLYERAGRIKDAAGSITLLPILTMPSDDISHPVPDLTGYITEGQIVCKRELHQRGIYPPVAGLPSVSRLMKDGVGKGLTREDHAAIAAQLFGAYAHAQEVRALAAVIGEEEISPQEKRYLEFATAFERQYVHQGERENRTIEETLDRAWEVAGVLPRSALGQLSEELIDRYHQKEAAGHDAAPEAEKEGAPNG
ncbi:MAG: V-type ATP synthase subunit B [Candidatus Brocadiia bacterium]|nr:V-type ATP synthase subunit B [Candidatus Brocadiia bacterium]